MVIDMGKISSRGQIAIPSDIRSQLGLEEGSKVLFFTKDNTLLIRKVTEDSFAHITEPLKMAAKKAGMKEKEVPELIHKFRK